jgi:CcmD family protein
MDFFVAAYLALWIGLFAYLLRIASRLRALRSEARALSADGRGEPASGRRAPLTPDPAAGDAYRSGSSAASGRSVAP